MNFIQKTTTLCPKTLPWRVLAFFGDFWHFLNKKGIFKRFGTNILNIYEPLLLQNSAYFFRTMNIIRLVHGDTNCWKNYHREIVR